MAAASGADLAPRPLPNQVDPFGELRAVRERGGFMGNRGGRIHRDDRTLGSRRWASKRWIVCLCEFKGRCRKIWSDGYTELFFLDEPTALAAGHRPCFECRREAATAFLAAFPGKPNSANAMDEILHKERLADGVKRLWLSPLSALPDGAMIVWRERAHAVRCGELLPWRFAGYGAPLALPGEIDVDVLTPRSTVTALANGYRARWASEA